jgi:dienelactone hydrolase
MRRIAHKVSPIISKYIMAALLALVARQASQAQTGDWHLLANGARMTLSISDQGSKQVAYVDAGGCATRLDRLTQNGDTLEFRRKVGSGFQWYRVEIADGILTGRFANSYDGEKPEPKAYAYRVTGWNEAAFENTPAVFDILVNKRSRARLRIDRTHSGNLIGRLKFYALDNNPWEYPEEDIQIDQWDGEALRFTRGAQVYSGTVEGRTIYGTFANSGGSGYPWSGTRAELLTYGLAPKTPEDRAAWQAKTRRVLYRLMMANNPAPSSVSVEILRDNIPPIQTATQWPDRDDDPEANPQNYTLTELRITYTVPTWMGPATRVVHAYLSKPTTQAERYPLVISLNGHAGSALGTFDGAEQCWSSDTWARRGYMVLAVDIGHRPAADVLQFGSTADWSTYLGYPQNSPPDEPERGNGYHASIKPDGFGALYTDFEEDGERTWDVMRALDYALGRGDVDPARVVVTGLSLGGQVTTYVGALDPRIAVTIPAGFSPDMSVIKYRGPHCWPWAFADLREMIDWSDVLAMIADRPLIVITGQQDPGFSSFPQHESFLPGVPLMQARFAADKQVIRRARVAGGPIWHYLHPQAHEYQTGVTSGGLRYALVAEPRYPRDIAWQVNTETATDGRTLFDYVRGFLNF